MPRSLIKSRPARILAIATFVIAAMGVAVVWSRFDRVDVIRAMQLRSVRVVMRAAFTLGKERPIFHDENPVGAILPIQELYLQEFTSADILGLAKFPELRFLCFGDAHLDGDSLKVLRSLPNLETIRFEMVDGLTDEGLKNLAYCKRLKSIGIWFGSGVTGSFLESLRGNVELSELELRWCSDLDGTIVKSLNSQPGLQIVVLTDCNLDGEGFDVFTNLMQLKRVEIDLPDKSLRKYFAHIPDTSFLERKVSPDPDN